MNKHWVCFCIQKMAMKISLQQKFFQSIKFKRLKRNKSGKHICSLNSKLMKWYKLCNHSRAVLHEWSPTSICSGTCNEQWAQWTILQVLQASQYCEHSLSAGKIIKQQERETKSIISERGWLESCGENGRGGNWQEEVVNSMMGIKHAVMGLRNLGVGVGERTS